MTSMQHWALTLDKFIEHAARWHGSREVVSRQADGSVSVTTYAAIANEARRLSAALLAAGIEPGDRVATMAMNNDHHVAAWFGITGIGAICHTLNPRLSDEHLVYIINDAGDRIVFADPQFAGRLSALRALCPSVEQVVTLGDAAFLSTAGTPPAWGGFDEHTPAGLCYTSGTTGRPKGVLYTHRSNYLHTLAILTTDVFGLSRDDVVLPIVPMFHANAWGLVFAAPAVGAKFVLPGAQLDGRSLYELIDAQQVTMAAGVPTVLQSLLAFLGDNDLRLPSLRRVLVGGAACMQPLLDAFDRHGIEVQHAWGMTEMSPLGTACLPTRPAAGEPDPRRKQGFVPFGVDMRIVDEAGNALPHDGASQGLLQVRGHSVVARYYGAEQSALTEDGFFETGDIGTIDAAGALQITDRAKDVIKSGGEWISSLELEAAALRFDGVVAAAALGAPCPRWGERPLLVVQARAGSTIDEDALRAFLATCLPKWWMPDRFAVTDALPLGATGKIDKQALRKLYLQD